MLFNSYSFLIFFPVVLLLYYAIPKKIRNVWLLIASYYFYMAWNIKYIVILLFVTGITYVGGIGIERAKTQRGKKWRMAGAVSVTFAVLFFFKIASELDLLLPIGISFYTFQAAGYLIDVYRGEVPAEKNVLKYALFVSFFPQLLAGPIARSKTLLPQFEKSNSFCLERVRDGLLTMLWGFFLKIVIADRIAIVVDTVYTNYEQYGGMYLLVATILFAVQIYGDFAGYSTIAVGAAKVLGFSLAENFKQPYFAHSVSEFWRRWHISLTSWFRDYVYIPLGGNRKGKIRKYINIVVVFLISGLWHGSEWSFVIWGGLNGIYQVVGEILKPYRRKATERLHLNTASFGHRILQVFCTFVCVDFAWIFFKAETVGHALAIVKSICTQFNPWVLFDGSLTAIGLDTANYIVMFLAIAVMFVVDYLHYKGISLRNYIIKQDTWFRWVFYIVALYCVVIFGIYGTGYSSSFIYFKF